MQAASIRSLRPSAHRTEGGSSRSRQVSPRPTKECCNIRDPTNQPGRESADDASSSAIPVRPYLPHGDSKCGPASMQSFHQFLAGLHVADRHPRIVAATTLVLRAPQPAACQYQAPRSSVTPMAVTAARSPSGTALFLSRSTSGSSIGYPRWLAMHWLVFGQLLATRFFTPVPPAQNRQSIGASQQIRMLCRYHIHTRISSWTR